MNKILKKLDAEQRKAFKLMVGAGQVHYTALKLKVAMRALGGNARCKHLLDVLQDYEVERAKAELLMP